MCLPFALKSFCISDFSQVCSAPEVCNRAQPTGVRSEALKLTLYEEQPHKKIPSDHLNKINVKRGERIRRGDIIGLSGNTGLSFAPHLHYEVIKDGMRVDPIHYFFMELNAEQYQKMLLIAQSGMQSLD